MFGFRRFGELALKLETLCLLGAELRCSNPGYLVQRVGVHLISPGDLGIQFPALLSHLFAQPPTLHERTASRGDSQASQKRERSKRDAVLRRDQISEVHTITSRALPHSSRLSARPFVPPLMTRVIPTKSSASAMTLRPLTYQYQPADSVAHSGCSSSSGS